MILKICNLKKGMRNESEESIVWKQVRDQNGMETG